MTRLYITVLYIHSILFSLSACPVRAQSHHQAEAKWEILFEHISKGKIRLLSTAQGVFMLHGTKEVSYAILHLDTVRGEVIDQIQLDSGKTPIGIAEAHDTGFVLLYSDGTIQNIQYDPTRQKSPVVWGLSLANWISGTDVAPTDIIRTRHGYTIIGTALGAPAGGQRAEVFFLGLSKDGTKADWKLDSALSLPAENRQELKLIGLLDGFIVLAHDTATINGAVIDVTKISRYNRKGGQIWNIRFGTKITAAAANFRRGVLLVSNDKVISPIDYWTGVVNLGGTRNLSTVTGGIACKVTGLLGGERDGFVLAASDKDGNCYIMDLGFDGARIGGVSQFSSKSYAVIGQDIMDAGNGEYVIAGLYGSYGSHEQYGQPGNMEKPFAARIVRKTVAEPTSIRETHPLVPARVYPNPANDRATIALDGNEYGTIAVYSMNGQAVMEVELRDGKAEVLRGNLPAGVYTYRVQTTAGRASGGSLIFR